MGQVNFLDYAKAQKMKDIPTVIKGDLAGKTVLITGANSGIGFEAAKHFATMNPARLIVVCRSVEKAQESIKLIQAETGYKNAEPMALDLSKFSSISEFAAQASQTLNRLDIVVENAAIYKPTYTTTEDGWETMLQVNLLGPALHVLLLLPTIINTARQNSVVPRIVLVSSMAIFIADIQSNAIETPNTLETLSSKEYCVPSTTGTGGVFANRYSETKILSVMFMRKLAELLPKIIVPVSPDPGFCVSGIFRELEGELAAWMESMNGLYAYTSEEGSRQIIYSAIGGKDEELRGKFTWYSQVAEISDWMLSEEGKKAEDKIWVEMLEILSKLDERIPGIIAEHLKV